MNQTGAANSGLIGVLLAAGFGRRFGTDKRLYPMPDGTPMALASALRLKSACGNVLTVVRPEDRELAGLFREAGCRVIASTDAAQGMGHSLAAAAKASPGGTDWLVALADMPFIGHASYCAVIDAMAAGASMARPVYRDIPGHPVGFSAAWHDRLAALTGDVGARGLARGAGRSCLLIEVDDPGVVRDIDTPYDCSA